MFDVNKGFKLSTISIKEHKLLKDFEIDFTDKEDNPLPIIVIAGVNGSGKTTLLEYIQKIHYSDLLYIKTLENNILDLKQYILSNFRKESRKLDSYSKALKKIQNFMEELFDGFDTKFYIDDIDDTDRYNEKIIFKNSTNDEFKIEELSTGEKTLISKILYLYFKDVKDKVILIDEAELSLHPSWQNKILKLYETFAEKNNCQIIIATHSPHIIGSAKNEWIRLLSEDGVISNFSKSYGLEFDKILTDIMGVENLRTPDVAKKIDKLWEFLEDEEYLSSEYKILYKELENIVGDLDKDLVLARLEVAKLKRENA